MADDDFAGSFGSFLDRIAPLPGAPGEEPKGPKKADTFEASFGPFVEEAAEQRRAAARLNLREANKSNPDEAARAVRLGFDVGLPPDTVERNLPDVEAMAKAARQEKQIRENPHLAQWLLDVNNAKQAHDDFDKLSFVEKVITSAKRGWDDAALANERGRLGYEALGTDPDGAQAARIKAIDADLTRPYGGHDQVFFRALNAASGLVGGIVDQGERSLVPAAVGGTMGTALGAVTGPGSAITGAAGATAGFLGGLVADSFVVTAGDLWLRFRSMRDDDGNPLDTNVAVGAALVGGLFAGALNLVGVKAAGGPVVEGTKRLIADTLSEAVTKPAVGRALAQFASQIGKSAATGAMFGAAIEGINVAAEQAAKVFDGGNWETILNDEDARRDAMNRIMSAATDMALGFGTLHLPVHGINLGANVQRARTAAQDREFLQRLSEGSAGSATRNRNADAFKRFVAAQTDGTPVENLYIPGARVRELYQSYGLDPFALDDDPILGFVPDIKEQLRQADATGGDVVVKTADYAAHLAGTKLHDALADDVRVRADGFSINEAKAFEKEYAEQTERQLDEARQANERDAAELSPAQRVADDVFRQARASGYTVDAARQYAALYAARYHARATRLGAGDAWSQYERSGVEIRAALPDSVQRVGVDQLDVVLNALRTGKGIESDRRLFGHSLLEFIAARGGIEDPGGELRGMDVDKWHVGKPFRRKLIVEPKPDAGPALVGISQMQAGNRFSPDDVARAAADDGYLPESRGERPSIEMLFEAIREELAGRPRYSEHRTANAAADFKAAVTDLDETLSRLGLDPKKLTNAEIKARLREQEAPEGGLAQSRAPRDGISPTKEGVEAWAAEVKQRLGLREFDVHLRSDGSLVLDFLAVPRDAQRQGKGTAAMQELTAYADQHGMLIELIPAQRDSHWGTTSRSRLVRFYKQFGFVENKGRAKDFTRKTDAMYREPQAREFSQSAAATNTPEFRAWFGDSKVVDEAGNPVVVYHGTDKNFRAFNLKKATQGIIWFTSDRASIEAGEVGAQGRGRIIEMYASIKNPAGWEEYGKLGLGELRSRGYDGAILREADGTFTGFAFEPTQLKSVDNRGTFDPSSPKLLEQSERGKITFADGRSIITLLGNRDLSTMLHETGHLWLEELVADAAASPAIKADLDRVLKWLGVDDAGKIAVEHHEQFARGVERYLMEGKAPSVGLVAAFERFKGWLLSIYRTVTNLNAPINDEIRAVMDRLVATDDEIKLALDRQSIRAQFDDASQAGMTNAEFKAYRQAVEGARASANEEALKKVMEDVRRRRTKEWRAEERIVRDEVSDAVNRRPEFLALHFLRTGRFLDGRQSTVPAMRLSREALVEMYGSDGVLSLLPAGVPPIFTTKNGVHPDAVAELFGFRGGQAMVDALMSLEAQQRDLRAGGNTQSLRMHLIEQEVQTRMVERHGDALKDGSIQEEALDAIHNDQQAAVFAAELRALGRRSGEVPTPLSVAREWAQRAVADKRVRDGTAVGMYARAEATAGRKVEQALLAGDMAEAFRAKQQQMLNHVLYIEAKAAAATVDAGVALMQKFAAAKTIKAMDQGYLEQIHGLLERFDFRDVSMAEVDRRTSFAAWAAEQEAKGFEIVAPASLREDAARKHYSDMTVNEFRGLDDTVRQIAHLGRMKRELLDAKEQREFDAVVDEAVAAVSTLRQIEPRDERNPGMAGRGAREKLAAAGALAMTNLRSLNASLRKVEAVVDVLDGGNSNGVFNRIVFRRISDAQNRENVMQREITDKLAAVYKAYPKESVRQLNRRISVPELVDSRTGRASALLKSEILAIALNVGNEGNFDKMARGEKWEPDAIRAALDRHMTKADWTLVQAIWDTVDSLWPEIAAVERRVNGVAPEKVAAVPVETPHGTFRGGYYPLIYDPARAFDVEQNRQRAADALFENNYIRPVTQKGHTVERVEGYARPLWLSLSALPGHVSRVIHDVAFREAVMDADRFLGDPRVREAVEGALGREMYKQFRPWLQGIANDANIDNGGAGFWDKFLRGARTNATVVGMGFRLTTMLAQGAGLADAAEYIGPRWMLAGLNEVRNPLKWIKARDFIFERSEEMRNRSNSLERDVRDGLRQLLGQSGFTADAKRFGFYGIALMDRAVTVPTWLGAYHKAMSEGKPEADAIYAADKAVRMSQGAGAQKDLVAVQRGPEATKLFTMFYSYFSHLYNRQADLGRSIRDIRSGGDFAMVLARTWWLLVVPPIINALVGGHGPKEDDDIAAWAATELGFNLVAGVPVVRDIGGAVKNQVTGRFGGGYQMSPASRAGDVLIDAATDVTRAVGLSDKEVSSRWLRHAIEAPGYIFGLPVGQAATSMQFLHDVMSGDADPDGVAEWLGGLVYGPRALK